MNIMEHAELERWLREERPEVLEELWRRADAIRREMVGDEVHLRGLIEISNHCARQCHYCGLRAGNRDLTRYRMSADEILECARAAARFGYGTVVMQAGEDAALTGAWVADVVRRIKAEVDLAVTLSLGERSLDELALWKEAGADRYLLRFETSNAELFSRIHPPKAGSATVVDRVAQLQAMRSLGYEIGSGVMIGIPGQSYADLARDLELFRELDLDMIGVGPFLTHPATPLAAISPNAGVDQAPATELMTYKMVALTRLCCPRANLPSTTALATLNLARGREFGLLRGANVVMPNLTPPKYRALYEIYPAKACVRETAEQCHGCLRRRIESIGRRVGQGRGSALRKTSEFR
ncbi:MAG: [FeFe] hydrogenase H-cluster radical SAM maturase HydE [Myxococcales bacterium]|jgi:biotin synthase|nr:[FeFe] hydrogenase H-cluster radical SAM maturase HydE [Myxococcales bacterium]